MSASVQVEVQGPVASITLHSADGQNLLTSPTFSSLVRVLGELADDRAVRVLRLQAKGPDFSLGRRGAGTAQDAEALHGEFRWVQACNEALAAFPGITVSAVQGRAVGAGLSLAGRCDVVLASDDARLSFPEVPQGIAPTIVLSYFGKKLPAKPLIHMLLTGREIDAHEGQRIGLVSEVVPAGELEQRSRAFSEQVAGLDEGVLRLFKGFWRSLDRMTVEDAAAYGIALLSIAMERKAER